MRQGDITLKFSYNYFKNLIIIYNARFKAARPEYNRRAFYFKAGMLFISAMGMEVSGLKIAALEEFASRSGVSIGLDPSYAYFAGVNGLFMGLALWRLLELYWWAKNAI